MAVLITLCAVFANYVYGGSLGSITLSLAFVLPILHVLRYPGHWSETMNVSLTLCAMILLAGLADRHGHPADPGSIIIWIPLSWLMFSILTEIYARLLDAGPRKVLTYEETQMSELDAATLYAHMRPKPDTENELVICGPANTDGLFSYSFKHKPVLRYKLTAAQLNKIDKGSAFKEYEQLLCKVSADSPNAFETIFVVPETNETSVATYTFTPQATGTLVTMRECSIPLTWLLRIGIWIEDYMADYLTCRIDLVEGRANRSIRLQSGDMLATDVARFFPQDRDEPDPQP